MELKKLGKFIYLIIMFIYGFVVLGLAVSSYSEIKTIANNFSYLMDNWTSDFINGISVSTSGACPSNYSPFFTYSWPGTNAGCYCSSLTSGACNSTQISRGCRTISAMASEQWSKWGNGAIICVKKIKGYNFAEKLLKYPLTCSSSEKTCLTSSEVKTCIPSSESCPITKFTVGTSPPTDAVYQSLYYFGSYNIYYTTEKAQLPAVEGLVMEDKPCEDKTIKNISPGRTDYMLMKSKKTRCTNYDSRWQSLGTIDESSFYNGNSKGSLSTTLPGYSISASYSWSQSIRNNFPWKYTEECRNNAYDVYKYKDKYNLAVNFQLIIMIINIIAAVFLSILYPFFTIQNLRGVDLSCFKGKGEEEKKRIDRWSKILKYLFKFIQLPFFIAAVIISGAIRVVFIIIANENCSDNLTNSQFKDVGDALNQKVYSGNITNLALLLAFLVLDIVLFIKGKYCPSKNSTQVQAVNSDNINNNNPDTAKGGKMMSPGVEMNPNSEKINLVSQGQAQSQNMNYQNNQPNDNNQFMNYQQPMGNQQYNQPMGYNQQQPVVYNQPAQVMLVPVVFGQVQQN